MEEMKGIAAAIDALGNTIANLERALYYARIDRDNAENRIKNLISENERLTEKLNAVHNYIERMEDA